MIALVMTASAVLSITITDILILYNLDIWARLLSRGFWEEEPQSLRRSWEEVALPAEHGGPDALVVDEVDGGAGAVGEDVGGSLEGGVDLGIEQLEADIELRDRVELGAGADLVEAPVRGAVEAER